MCFRLLFLGDMLFRKLTVANMQHTLCMVCHIEIMRDHHNGDALLVELLEQLHDLRAGLAVGAPVGSSAKKEFSDCVDDGAGDRDARWHWPPEEKLVRLKIHTVAETYTL